MVSIGDGAQSHASDKRTRENRQNQMKNVQWRCTRSTNFLMFRAITFQAHRAHRWSWCSTAVLLPPSPFTADAHRSSSRSHIFFLFSSAHFSFCSCFSVLLFIFLALVFPIGWNDVNVSGPIGCGCCVHVDVCFTYISLNLCSSLLYHVFLSLIGASARDAYCVPTWFLYRNTSTYEGICVVAV